MDVHVHAENAILMVDRITSDICIYQSRKSKLLFGREGGGAFALHLEGGCNLRRPINNIHAHAWGVGHSSAVRAPAVKGYTKAIRLSLNIK